MRRVSVLLCCALSGCGGSTTSSAKIAAVTVSIAGGGAPRIGALGGTLQLAATARDGAGNVISGAAFGWSSSDAGIATVEGTTGLVTARAPGTATVFALAGGTAGALAVLVQQDTASIAIAEQAPAALTFFGQTLQLHAKAKDASGSTVAGAAITWHTDAPLVALVDGAGLVSAQASGRARIFAAAGGHEAALTITVAQSVAALSLSAPGGTAVTLTALGATEQLSAQAADSAGHPVSGFAFSWSSSDAAVATVDGTGLVTAQGNGHAAITASAGSGGPSAQLGVTVAQQPDTASITPALVTLERGATRQLAAAGVDARGSPIAGLSAAWSITPGTIASISSTGLVTGLAVGQAIASATLGGRSAQAAIAVVVPGVAAVQIAEHGLPTLDRVGATVQLHATATDARGAPVPEAQPVWNSSAALVATVGATSGLVTAVADGSAVITAAVGTLSSGVAVSVAQAVAAAALNVRGGAPSTLAALGATLQLDAQALDGGGAPVPGVTFTFAICDGAAITAGCASTVASVGGTGLVTALANGAARVQASGGGKQATLGLVVAQRVATVAVAPTSDTVGPGKSSAFAATITDSFGQLVTPAPGAIWSSSKPSLVTIDQAGLANATSTIQSAIDQATITAAVDDGAVHTGTATLFVDPNARAVSAVTVTGAAGFFTALGEQRGYGAQAVDAAAVPIAGLAYSWSSSAPAVFSVAPTSPGAATATVTIVGPGSGTLTARAGGKDGTAAIAVHQQIASVSAGGALTSLSSLGDTLALSGLDSTGHPIAGRAVDPFGAAWTTCDGPSDPPCGTATILSVGGAGLVTALANGLGRVTGETLQPVAGSTPVATTAHLDVAVVQQVVSLTAPGSTTLASLGETLQLTALDARLSPVAAAGLAWSTSDASIASVGSSGLITAKQNGAVTITAKGPADAGTTIGVTVAQAVAQVQTVPASASSTLTSKGDTLQLAAFDGRGQPVAGAQWFACDGTGAPGCAAAVVASVSASGLVTALANGSARVTAKRGSEAGAFASVQVSQQVASVTAASGPLTSFGQTAHLFALDARGNPIPTLVTWTACDGAASPPCASSLVTVDNAGLVTSLQNGSARITAATTLGAAASTASSDVLVEQHVAQVTAAGGLTTLNAIGEQVQLAASDANGHPVLLPVNWSSDNTLAVTVDGGGLANAVADGSANLTARGPNDTGVSLAISVLRAVAAVETTVGGASTTLASVGDTLQLRARDASGGLISSGITWKACDGAATSCLSGTVAAVDSGGLVTALKNGAARVNATRGGGSAFLDVTVAQVVASVSVTPASATVAVGATQQFTATALDARSNAVSGAPSATWGSANTGIAGVSSSGLATGAAIGGPIAITGTNSGKSGSGQLSVTAPVCTTSIDVTSPGFNFSFNGVDVTSTPGTTFAVCKGTTVTFHVRTDINHPFCIWNPGDTNAPAGVTNNCITNGNVVWQIPAAFSSGARYHCFIHSFGGSFLFQ